MSGPGRTKLPINFYISRQHMAVVNAEAREQKTSKTAVIHSLLDALQKRRERAGKKTPRPVAPYKAKWFERQKKKKAV